MTPEEKRHPTSIAQLQHLHPSVQRCARCGIPDFECDPKSFVVGNRYGTWVLCDYCWNQSTHEERLAFYKAWYYKMEYWFKAANRGKFNVTMDQIIEAVSRESIEKGCGDDYPIIPQ